MDEEEPVADEEETTEMYNGEGEEQEENRMKELAGLYEEDEDRI